MRKSLKLVYLVINRCWMLHGLTRGPYPFLTHLFSSNWNNIQPSYETWQNAEVQLSSRKCINSQIASVFHCNSLLSLCLTVVPKSRWVVLQYKKYHSWQECVWLKPVVHCNFIQQYSIIKSTCSVLFSSCKSKFCRWRCYGILMSTGSGVTGYSQVQCEQVESMIAKGC